MKSKIITDNEDLLIMFRLGGIEGILADNEIEAKEEFDKAIKDEELAVLVLTTHIYEYIESDVKEFRELETHPLIVKVDG